MEISILQDIILIMGWVLVVFLYNVYKHGVTIWDGIIP